MTKNLEYGVRIKSLNEKLDKLTKSLSEKLIEDEKCMADQSNSIVELKQVKHDVKKKTEIIEKQQLEIQVLKKREEDFISAFKNYLVQIQKQNEQITTLKKRCLELEEDLFHLQFHHTGLEEDTELATKNKKLPVRRKDTFEKKGSSASLTKRDQFVIKSKRTKFNSSRTDLLGTIHDLPKTSNDNSFGVSDEGSRIADQEPKATESQSKRVSNATSKRIISQVLY